MQFSYFSTKPPSLKLQHKLCSFKAFFSATIMKLIHSLEFQAYHKENSAHKQFHCLQLSAIAHSKSSPGKRAPKILNISELKSGFKEKENFHNLICHTNSEDPRIDFKTFTRFRRDFCHFPCP
jgi:hypothetical protein